MRYLVDDYVSQAGRAFPGYEVFPVHDRCGGFHPAPRSRGGDVCELFIGEGTHPIRVEIHDLLGRASEVVEARVPVRGMQTL